MGSTGSFPGGVSSVKIEYGLKAKEKSTKSLVNLVDPEDSLNGGKCPGLVTLVTTTPTIPSVILKNKI